VTAYDSRVAARR